jgi:hypothetical protein
VRCAALGCPKKPALSGLWCRRHWEKLSEDLRAPNQFRSAIAHLGKLDGYLVEVPKKRATITDNKGSEYV